jgi:Co/Zn/Cd efflux system component
VAGRDHWYGAGHDHGHPSGDVEHAHAGVAGLWPKLTHLLTPHSHDASGKVDSAMQTSRDGIRALWISLAVLGATAAVQAVVVFLSGSVALLSDTLHNAADALTAIPLGVAFILGRRMPTRR